MDDTCFPEMITGLPQADLPIDGIHAWLSQGSSNQVVFLEIDSSAKVPPHSHGEQWGIVVQGEMQLTVQGVTRFLKQGDSYHISAGVEHGARFLTNVRIIDVFADPDRYKPRQS